IGTPDGWAERAAQVRASGTPSLVQGSASRWFAPGFIEREPHLTGGLLKDLTEVDDESYARCVELLGSTDLRDKVGDVAAPLTIIAGAEDAVIAIPEAESVVAAARAGRLTVLPGVAHQATVENPAEVATILTKEVPA